MIEVDGWKDPNIELPSIGVSILACTPGDSWCPFKIMRLGELGLLHEGLPVKAWSHQNGQMNFDCVSRWMYIPLFAEWDHVWKNEPIKIEPITNRFEIMDL